MSDMVHLAAVTSYSAVFNGVGGGISDMTVTRDWWERSGKPQTLIVHTTQPAWGEDNE